MEITKAPVNPAAAQTSQTNQSSLHHRYEHYVDPNAQPGTVGNTLLGVSAFAGGALSTVAARSGALASNRMLRLGLYATSAACAFVGTSVGANYLFPPVPNEHHKDPITGKYYAPGSLLVRKNPETGEFEPIVRETTDLATGEKRQTVSVVVGFTGQDREALEEVVTVRNSDGSISRCTWQRDLLWTTRVEKDMSYACDRIGKKDDRYLSMVTAQLTPEEYEVIKRHGYWVGLSKLGYIVGPDRYGNPDGEDVSDTSRGSVVVNQQVRARYHVELEHPCKVSWKSYAGFAGALPRAAIRLCELFEEKWPGVKILAKEEQTSSAIEVQVEVQKKMSKEEKAVFKKEFTLFRRELEEVSSHRECLGSSLAVRPQERTTHGLVMATVAESVIRSLPSAPSNTTFEERSAAYDDISRLERFSSMSRERADHLRARVFTGEKIALMRKKGASGVSDKELRKAQAAEMRART